MKLFYGIFILKIILGRFNKMQLKVEYNKAALVLLIFTIISIFAGEQFISSYKISIKNNPWFNNVKSPTIPTQSELKKILEYLYHSFGSKNKSVFPNISQKHDQTPQLVFISVSDGEKPAFVELGKGNGFKNSFKQAFLKLKNTLPTGFRPQWVRIDIVNKVYSHNNYNFNKPLRLNYGIDGIAFDEEYQTAFLPSEIPAYGLYNSKQKIRPDRIIKFSKSFPPEKREQFLNLKNHTLYYFNTISFFFDGNKAVNLYRGHSLFDRISSADALQAARLGGDYLIRSVNSKGKFDYLYNPVKDRVASSYNILRHAGTVYSLLELYEITCDQRLLDAARRGVKYLNKAVKPSGNNALCIVEDNYVKLGGNALACIALAKYIKATNDKQYFPVLLKLAQWFRGVQAENGRFTVHKKSYPDGKVSNFDSIYYPGEAILALIRVYTVDPNPKWLDLAERGAEYLIKVRDKGLPVERLPHDHWLLYALNELYRYRPNPLYLNHALKIARAIVQSQIRNHKYPDFNGGYYLPPRSTPAATRAEGLCAAYSLARDYSPEDKQAILNAIENGIEFQLQTQFWPESVMFFKNPERALGGFYCSFYDFDVRIDYVQHNISSLLGYWKIKNGYVKKSHEN